MQIGHFGKELWTSRFSSGRKSDWVSPTENQANLSHQFGSHSQSSSTSSAQENTPNEFFVLLIRTGTQWSCTTIKWDSDDEREQAAIFYQWNWSALCAWPRIANLSMDNHWLINPFHFLGGFRCDYRYANQLGLPKKISNSFCNSFLHFFCKDNFSCET